MRGRIADPPKAASFLRHMVERAGASLNGALAVVATSDGLTPDEQRAVVETVRLAGASHAEHFPATVAAALGAGAPVYDPPAILVADFGAARTQAALLAFGGIVASASTTLGSRDIDAAIAQWLMRKHRLQPAPSTLDVIKRQVVSCTPRPDEDTSFRVGGRDVTTGADGEIEVHTHQLLSSLNRTLPACIRPVLDVLAETPPDAAADLFAHGLLLTGGGSQLRGLRALLRAHTGLPVFLSDQPEAAIIRGLNATHAARASG